MRIVQTFPPPLTRSLLTDPSGVSHLHGVTRMESNEQPGTSITVVWYMRGTGCHLATDGGSGGGVMGGGWGGRASYRPPQCEPLEQCSQNPLKLMGQMRRRLPCGDLSRMVL